MFLFETGPCLFLILLKFFLCLLIEFSQSCLAYTWLDLATWESSTSDCYKLLVKQVQGKLGNHCEEVVHRKIRGGFPDFFPRCSSLTGDWSRVFPPFLVVTCLAWQFWLTVMNKLPYKRKPTFIYCLQNKLANKAFISLLVTPQNRRPSLVNYLLCLSVLVVSQNKSWVFHYLCHLPRLSV